MTEKEAEIEDTKWVESASKLAKRIHSDGAPYHKGTTEPAGAVEGDLFFNTASNVMFTHNGSAFVKISSEIAVLSSVTGDYFGLSKSLLFKVAKG